MIWFKFSCRKYSTFASFLFFLWRENYIFCFFFFFFKMFFHRITYVHMSLNSLINWGVALRELAFIYCLSSDYVLVISLKGSILSLFLKERDFICETHNSQVTPKFTPNFWWFLLLFWAWCDSVSLKINLSCFPQIGVYITTVHAITLFGSKFTHFIS